MTNTLTKIADLREKAKRKEGLLKLTVNKWLREYDPEKEKVYRQEFNTQLDAYKEILRKIDDLETDLVPSLPKETE